MCVNHAANVRAAVMDRAVNHRPCFVYAVVQRPKVRLAQDIAVMVNFKQTGCRDFFVHHAIGINKIGALLARDASRDVVGDHVGHAIHLY